MPAGGAGLIPAWVRWTGLAAFTVFVVVGLARLNPSPPAAAAAAVLAIAAGAALAAQWQPLLGYAALATGGIAVLGNGQSSNVGWFAVCLLGAWCVLAGRRRDGLIYWAGAMALFAAEWLWVQPDPGWAAWLAGTTFSVLAGLLIRRELDLVAQLRAAQAGLAARARAEERNRIARELHDVIAHTLTVLLLHVSSARLAVEHDLADAGRALAEAERLGQESLAEVRRAVGMLHRDGGTATPLPGADGVATLVERFRSAGADVTLSVRRRPRPAARHHRPGRVPHRAGGADQRGQARARRAHHGPAGRRRGRGPAGRGQRGAARHRHRDGPAQHARARRVAGRKLPGRAGRPGLAGAGHAAGGRGGAPEPRDVIRVLVVDDQDRG